MLSTEQYVVLLICLGIIWLFIIAYLCIAIRNRNKSKAKRKVKKLAKGVGEYTPEEFFDARNAAYGNLKSLVVEGVYILHNTTKDLYYVGQAIDTVGRINSHLTGKGNGDVYADYKYGDAFTIKILPLDSSGCATLNELERCTIDAYDACRKGYNKTRGNRG